MYHQLLLDFALTPTSIVKTNALHSTKEMTESERDIDSLMDTVKTGRRMFQRICDAAATLTMALRGAAAEAMAARLGATPSLPGSRAATPMMMPLILNPNDVIEIGRMTTQQKTIKYGYHFNKADAEDEGDPSVSIRVLDNPNYRDPSSLVRIEGDACTRELSLLNSKKMSPVFDLTLILAALAKAAAKAESCQELIGLSALEDDHRQLHGAILH
ncbi:hypothetical protein INS49_001361 [Diaporthe citri]|uniref:uncharacterized protein n=1 Tax=Diaporthe citri TaxID=83186 RepID=UPI001C8155C7|nr:uncharacterized protein INS49_001361 [Diaporthe citri]KAG6367176.1 hypothetical protein INS49_001361 [Diaporthe citri]